MCGPEDPLFTPLLQFARVLFQAKESVHKTPLLRKKFGNFSLNSLNFRSNFSSQAPNLEIFSSQASPFSEANSSSQAPHFGNPGLAAHPYLKKVECPPPASTPHPLTLTAYPTPGKVVPPFFYFFFFMKMTAKDVKEITFMSLVTFFSVLQRPGKP